jgi:putative membrane protein
MMTGWGMGFGGIWMMLVMVLAWALIIVGAIWLLAALFPKASGGNRDAQSGDNALTILQQRYARGEITKEEYEAIRHDIEQ